MSKFPIVREAEEKSKQEPFVVEYTITANGWRASGGIKYEAQKEKEFWGLLEMVVTDIMRGDHVGILNESYMDGFSRYRRPVKRDDFTLRWEELDYQSSEQTPGEANRA